MFVNVSHVVSSLHGVWQVLDPNPGFRKMTRRNVGGERVGFEVAFMVHASITGLGYASRKLLSAN